MCLNITGEFLHCKVKLIFVLNYFCTICHFHKDFYKTSVVTINELLLTKKQDRAHCWVRGCSFISFSAGKIDACTNLPTYIAQTHWHKK